MEIDGFGAVAFQTPLHRTRAQERVRLAVAASALTAVLVASADGAGDESVGGDGPM